MLRSAGARPSFFLPIEGRVASQSAVAAEPGEQQIARWHTLAISLGEARWTRRSPDGRGRRGTLSSAGARPSISILTHEGVACPVLKEREDGEHFGQKLKMSARQNRNLAHDRAREISQAMLASYLSSEHVHRGCARY